jgi:hypothetical protein
MNIIRLGLTFTLLMTSLNTLAEEFWQQEKYNNQDKVIIRAGLQSGGDQIGTVYEDTNNTYQEKIRAGGYYQFAVGYDVAFNNSPLSVQFSYGLVRDSGRGQDLSMIAIHSKVIELIPFYHYKQHRIGLGVSHHLDPVMYNKQRSGTDFEFHFEDEPTWILQYDFKYSRNVMFGMRYSQVEYTVEAAKVDGVFNSEFSTAISGEKLNADAFGVHVIFNF